MSLAILSWLAVAVGAVCLLAAAVSTSGKWDALCTLRVAEAFPAGSDPAAAAAWLCPLRLDTESTEQALGFSCDLLLPTMPPTLAGNASNTTLDPSALAIPVCGNNTGFESRAEARSSFENDFGWMLTLAYYLALVHGLACTARAWAALSAWMQGVPSRRPLQLLLLLQDMLLPPAVPLPASVQLVVGRPSPLRLWTSWVALSLTVAATLAQLQYNDVDGVCFIVAGVMAVLSALLAIGTLPAEAVPSPPGSGSKRPVTIPEAAASICWVVLVVQAVGMACWAGQLLECWGSVWLGVAPSLRDPTLVSELQCGSGWTTALAVCILLWGALPVPLACAGAAVRWPGMRNLVCDARGHVAVRLLGPSMIGASLLVFSMALPEYNSDTFVAGLFLTLFFAILGLGARLLHLLFERSQTPFDGERLLRHFQVPTGLRGSVTTDVAKDALAVVQARLR